MRQFSAALAGLLLLASPALAQKPDKSTVVVAFGTDAQTLEPADINSRDTQNIADHIWGSLYEIDDNGKVSPYLADGATESADGKEITFKLKPGLSCHDGSPLTAEDVAFSFQRTKDPVQKFTGSTAGFVMSALGYKGARVVDPQTVVIELNDYNPIALGLIAEVKIVCKAPYTRMSRQQATQTPVGTGPYRFVEWVKSDHITLERVPGFMPRKATFDRIVFRVI